MQNSRGSKPGGNNNWKVVVLAIFGAATFWFFNALNKNYDTRVNYPLEFIFNRDSAIVVSPLPEEVYIDVNGGGWNLIRKTFWLNTSPIKIELDNPTEVKYYTQSSLVPVISGQLGGLRLNYVVTDSIFLDIEEKVVMRVKIVVDSLSVPLEDNHRIVSRIAIQPDSATLTGPKSLMENLGPSVLGRFTEDKIDQDFDSEIALDLKGNGLITSNIRDANVTFEVDEFIRHTMSVQIETLRFSSKKPVYLSDSLVNLSFTVNESKVEELNASDFGVIVDYVTRDKSDSTVIPALMYYPNYVYDIEVLTEKVKLIYSD